MPRTYRTGDSALREDDERVQNGGAEAAQQAADTPPDDQDLAPSDVPPLEAAPAFDAGLSEEKRRRMIAEAAYYIAQSRGFVGGLELDDWLTAEAEVNARLTAH